MIADKRSDLIISSILKYVTDIEEVKGIGFCVSKDHATYMADYFNSHGISSIALTSDSSDKLRSQAKTKLVKGEIRFIFVVDIYNEGVDIPEINTVLFLRPTESLTIFLQQLGRGLRLAENKDCLTVLDFIGQANHHYNFEEKFRSLELTTNRNLISEVKNGFNSLPKGCFIQLEKKASQNILNNIRATYNNRNGIINKIRNFPEESLKELNLPNFLDHYHLSPGNIYRFDSFNNLYLTAQRKKREVEPLDKEAAKILTRFASIDSRRLIEFLLNILPNLEKLQMENLSELERRMFQIFYITVFSNEVNDFDIKKWREKLKLLIKSPNLLKELFDLLKYNLNKIDFIDKPVNLGFESPLDLYCTYSRDQILAALDFKKPSTVREGVKWLSEKNIDVLFITLNKSDKDYSPTTLYNDYSINETLFHWQSQSTISENSITGQRYINHRKQGSKVLLFVRETKKNPNNPKIAAPYTFLGTANYQYHYGNKPMNIVWKLDNPIPAKYLKKTNKLLAL